MAGAFAVSPLSGRAAFEERPPSARAAGLAEAGSAAWAGGPEAYYNAAGLAFARRRELTAGYGRLFGLADLPFESAAYAGPRTGGGAGLSFTQFGSALYREQELGLAGAFRLSPAAALGGGLKYSALRVKRYGSSAAWGLDAGGALRPHPKVDAGFSARNINHPSFEDGTQGPAPDLRAGLAFRPAAGFLTVLDAVKPVRGELSWRAGEEIAVSPFLDLRFGLRTAPNRYALGFGLRFKSFRLDYALLSHPLLQDQHHAGFGFAWGPADDPPAEPAPLAVQKRPRSRRAKAPPKSRHKPLPSKPVNINTASPEELMTLPGVGRATAQKIIERRAKHGPFKSLKELLKLPRFSRRTYIRLAPYAVLEDPVPAEPPRPPDGPPEPAAP
ncbi:MAG: helix-hairpin-helix domain-containing protein [Elusimicrobiota bacterium]